MIDSSVSIWSCLSSAVFVASMWICSFTLFLPAFIVLSFSDYFRSKFFTFVLVTVLRHVIPKVDIMRRILFDAILQHCKPDERLSPLRILEIGVGDGANFALYPKNCSVTLLDKNPNFASYMREKLEEFPDLNVERIIISPAEHMKDLEDNSFDVVISTHFLCSVTDVDLVLQEVYRVLKPGGIYGFADHTAFKENFAVYCLQKWVKPVWTIYFDGCCPDRDILRMVGRHFKLIKPNTLYPRKMPLLLRSHAVGLGLKR